MQRQKERITITIDPELLARLDAVGESRGEPRSALIERMLENEIKHEEVFLRDMENPIYRGLARALVASPTITKAIIAAAQESLTPEQLKHFQEHMPQQIEAGRERQEKKKQKPKVREE